MSEDKGEKNSSTMNGGHHPSEGLPEFDFITFVLSLHRSAACHLGRAPDPETNTCQENMPLAKQTIDILSMLLEKTQGNLTGEEERILSEVLYDLRMAFVKAQSEQT